MTKSKSFKSLGDLKDLDLFKSETSFSSKQSNPKELASEPKSQEEKRELAVRSSAITQPVNVSTHGTKDQEDSYQARLEWVDKRERDLSLLELELSRVKTSLDHERNELSIQRFSIESDQKKHENRLSKLNDLEEFERILSARKSSIELKDNSLKKKAEDLSTLKTKLQKEMHSLETQLKKALSEATSASLKIESRDKKIAALKKDVDASLISKKNIEIKLLELKKELAVSVKTIAGFEAPHNIKLDIWEFVEFITKKGAKPVELGYANNKIAICGDAPWKKNDFIEFLKSKGFSPAKSISPDVEIAVVGRDFDCEELEGQLVLRQGRKIHFYSQELLIASIASGINPLTNPRPYKELLEKFSNDHPGLLFLQDGFKFPWPLSNISDSVTLEFKHDGSVKESPLVRVGYHVGKENGRTQAVRRKILENSFYGEYDDTEEWNVESDEYMKRWGRSKSRTRLHQMSHHIHALITSRRRLPSHSQAVEEWEDDLRWLKKFYKPYMSFKWPVLK